jgi:hypothetical protein
MPSREIIIANFVITRNMKVHIYCVATAHNGPRPLGFRGFYIKPNHTHQHSEDVL